MNAELKQLASQKATPAVPKKQNTKKLLMSLNKQWREEAKEEGAGGPESGWCTKGNVPARENRPAMNRADIGDSKKIAE